MGKSLGISIVGGRGMGSRLSNGEVMRGIFIKHILEDSPAGRNGTLKTGDRIVQVCNGFAHYRNNNDDGRYNSTLHKK